MAENFSSKYRAAIYMEGVSKQNLATLIEFFLTTDSAVVSAVGSLVTRRWLSVHQSLSHCICNLVAKLWGVVLTPLGKTNAINATLNGLTAATTCSGWSKGEPSSLQTRKNTMRASDLHVLIHDHCNGYFIIQLCVKNNINISNIRLYLSCGSPPTALGGLLPLKKPQCKNMSFKAGNKTQDEVLHLLVANMTKTIFHTSKIFFENMRKQKPVHPPR